MNFKRTRLFVVVLWVLLVLPSQGWGFWGKRAATGLRVGTFNLHNVTLKWNVSERAKTMRLKGFMKGGKRIREEIPYSWGFKEGDLIPRANDWQHELELKVALIRKAKLDVLAVQEVESEAALQVFIEKLARGGAGKWTGRLVQEPGQKHVSNVAILSRTADMDVRVYSELEAFEGERPPLKATITAGDKKLTLFVVHFKSNLTYPPDKAKLERFLAKRRAHEGEKNVPAMTPAEYEEQYGARDIARRAHSQAKALAKVILDEYGPNPQENILVVGDFNRAPDHKTLRPLFRNPQLPLVDTAPAGALTFFWPEKGIYNRFDGIFAPKAFYERMGRPVMAVDGSGLPTTATKFTEPRVSTWVTPDKAPGDVSEAGTPPKAGTLKSMPKKIKVTVTNKIYASDHTLNWIEFPPGALQ